MKLVDLEKPIQKVLNDGLASIGQDTFDKIKNSLGIQGDSKTHSAPGEAPYRQSGDLEDAGKLTIAGNKISIAWGDKTVWMEFGTRTIEPRPFLQPAYDNLRKTFGKQMARYFEANFKI